MNDRDCMISIIIPAYNEQNYIANTLKNIIKHFPPISYEIIVVDNGSEDETAMIAREFQTTVVDFPEGTIAAVRNRGVTESKGKILIFLDADILLTNEWKEGIEQVINQLLTTPKLITGSRCKAPSKNTWLYRYWFNRTVTYNSPYINSGHLITTRYLFDRVGGFSEKLYTAEDYDFCMKATKVGAINSPSPLIPVIHEGFPETIYGFIRREIWHGREDLDSIKTIVESKVAWVAIFHLILILFCALSIKH